ncbi:MAG TPA: hypothetical protein VGC42_14700 [Kofleriaceae bacterium]
MARTAFGQSAGPQPAAPPLPPPLDLGFQATLAAPPPAQNPAVAPRPHSPSAPPPLNPASQPVNPNFVPAVNSNAKTLFVQAPAAAPGPGSHSPAATPASQLATLVPGNQYAPAPMPPQSQPQSQPQPQPVFPQVNFQVKPSGPMPAPMAIPQAMNQYSTGATGITRSRVIDPYRRTLPMMMFLWGVALLAVFATPLTTSPMTFHWTTVLEGAGLARLIPLTFAAVGLLGVLLAVIPMPSYLRGLLAALLGLAGIAMPFVVAGVVPGWQALVPLAGALIIIPALIMRAEYRDSLFARLLVTFGAAALLLPFLLPQNGVIPLVDTFKQLIEAPGLGRVAPALIVVYVVIVVMALLAWLPSPITGGAIVWAWMLILWGLVVHVVELVLAGGIPEKLTGAPNATLLGWVVGLDADKASPLLGAAYLVFVGYGLAAFLGKQLE